MKVKKLLRLEVLHSMRFVNIEREKRKSILEKKIDKYNYLSMGKERTTLIKLGIAMGLDNPRILKSKDPLVRPEYVKSNPELTAIIACSAIEHMDENADLNQVLESGSMFGIAEECLNEGLNVIEDQIDNMPTNNFRLRMIEELEELYLEKVID